MFKDNTDANMNVEETAETVDNNKTKSEGIGETDDNNQTNAEDSEKSTTEITEGI